MSAKLTCGQMIQGRYCVVKLLGEGGFGAVYLVQDTRLGGRRLALKESFDNSREAQQQFQLEATLLAGLSHPNLPRVSDYFIEPTGRQYLVMDFIEGQDLTDMIINRRTPLPESQALTWMIQVSQAVALLHSQRPKPIIHRDIKPPNIKITPAGQAVLVDFGIAKLYEAHKGTARIAKAFSPGFSPYEQYAGGTDARSDVYALGATLYCMLTATVPPDAFQERLIQHVALTPPRQINPKVSSVVERVILQAMEMDPNRRFLSAAELVQALEACTTGGAVVTPSPVDPSANFVCPACGAVNRSGAKFCARDGALLSGRPAVTPPVGGQSAGPMCPRCGAVNRPGTKFCARDGTPLIARSAAAPAVAPMSPPIAPAIAPELSFEMGNAYARNDQHDEAIRAYRQALTGGFTDQALYHNLGLVYIMAQRPGDAIPILSEGVKRYAKDGDLHYQLGRACALVGRLEDAASELEQAVRLQPMEFENHLMLAMVYQDLKRHAQAVSELEALARQKKDVALVHYLLGKSYFLTDQFDRAEKSLVEAVRLDATEGNAHFFLGWTRLHKKRPDLAVQSLSQAVKLQPDNALAHYFLGEAHLVQDNYQEALRWFQRAANLDPTDPDPHTQMGVCYALLRRRTDAIAAVKQALAIDPSNHQARTLLGKL